MAVKFMNTTINSEKKEPKVTASHSDLQQIILLSFKVPLLFLEQTAVKPSFAER